MNKEESIQKIQDQIDKVKEYIEYGMPYGEYLQLQLAFENIVNLIQKQEKIIAKMAEYMKEKDIDEDICTKNVINPQLCNEEYSNCKECIKEYFKKEAEKDVKD